MNERNRPLLAQNLPRARQSRRRLSLTLFSIAGIGGFGLALATAAPVVRQDGTGVTKPTGPQPAATPAPALNAATPASGLGIDPTALDRAVKPCDDFYRYACGGWLSRTAIPDDRPSWSRGFSEINERNQTVLRQILEEAGKGGGDALTQKLGSFYAACMAEDQIEKNAAGELAEQLKPIADIKSLDDVAKEVARQHAGFGAPFFAFTSQQDFRNATRVIAGADQGGLGLPDRDYYTKTDPKSEELRKEYLVHIEKMLTLAGVPAAQAKTDAATIYGIEKKLAEASMGRVERRDPTKLYHRIELDGLKKLAPKFPWAVYLGGLGFPTITTINVLTPDFFSGLNKVLEATPLADLKTYLRWTAIHGSAPLLSKAFVDENFRFYSQRLTGTAKILPRWKRCVAATDRALGEALGARFADKVFGRDGKAQAQEIIRGIESAMAKNLKELPWMDDATRKAALTKLAKIANKIGFPDKPRDYRTLTVDGNSFLRSALNAHRFESKRDLTKIGKPLDRSEWLMSAPTVNAYYEPLLNEIVFPAGILQPPMFGRGVPVAVNYGAIGMVMGHEVTHGFDDEGRQFDAAGNLKDWWSPKVSSEFDRKASCVVDQYAGYTPVESLHLDGKLTLGENIADLGGLKLAYHAYKEATAKQAAQDAAKNGEFSNDQLFFIGMAQAWCDKRRPEYSRLLVTVDPHSPPEYRVNGPLSNLQEFATAFSCAKDSKMVRQNLCTVW